MSREIKFRCFDDGKMYYSDNQEDAKILGAKLGQSCIATFFNRFYGHPNLEQYTGVKDKKGVEIYEGDILKFPFGSIAYVINDGFQIGLKSPGSEAVSYYEYKEMYEICEVIGNIHQNPEFI